MIYQLLFKLVLRRIPAETAHALAAFAARSIGALPGGTSILRRLVGPQDASLRVEVLGRVFPSPLGVAAGMDKNLTWYEELGALGFGFVEVGTVTALPQQGNARPRVHRLIEARGLVNSMGFPNDGALAASKRLTRRTGQTIVGVNIGKSRAATDVLADYRQSATQLGPLADFLVLNVSSPNTPGLRDIQETGALTELIAAVRAGLAEVRCDVPVLIKLSPDITDDHVDALGDLAITLQLDGIVAVNTTTSRSGSSAGASGLQGGVSGAPLKERALEVLERLASRTEGKIPLISVGGIETADDAWERILAGASLVQAHTGFVYGGPRWPSLINRGLAARVRSTGATSIQDLIGTAARSSRVADDASSHESEAASSTIAVASTSAG